MRHYLKILVMIIVVNLVMFWLHGVLEKYEPVYDNPITYLSYWDDEPAVCFSNPSGSIKAYFKLRKLSELQHMLYDRKEDDK